MTGIAITVSVPAATVNPYCATNLANGDFIQCVMTSNDACTTPGAVLSNKITMSVFPNLVVSVSISASSTTICPGTLVCFTATPVNAGNPPQYKWKRNGSIVNGQTNQIYCSSTLINGDYITCTITPNANAGPCLVTSTLTSNPITITVTNSITPTIIASPSTSICPDSTAALKTSVTYNSYKWSTGSTKASISGLTAGSYSVTVSNSGSCTGSASIKITQSKCGTPTNVTAGSITSKSALISWSAQSCANYYQVRYRVTGTTTWTNVTPYNSSNPRTISGLTQSTSYDFQVRTSCSGVNQIYSLWSAIQTFTTLPSCDPVTGITVTNLSKTGATISWNAAANAYSYKLVYRIVGTATWTAKTILAPAVSKALTGLNANTKYEFQIRTICDTAATTKSAWTALKNFTTPMRMEETGFSSSNDFHVYPNPNKGDFKIEWSNTKDEIVNIRVYNLLGEILFAEERNCVAGDNIFDIDLKDPSAGLYTIRLKTKERNSIIKFSVTE